MRKERTPGVRTKAIQARFFEPFRDRLEAWVQEHCDGNQTEAARKLGIAQATISDFLGNRRSLGLAVLLGLYEKTGITPNEWLGIEPARRDEPDPRLIDGIVAGLADMLERRRGSEPPEPEPSPEPPARRLLPPK